jgi:hypothetical protein
VKPLSADHIGLSILDEDFRCPKLNTTLSGTQIIKRLIHIGRMYRPRLGECRHQKPSPHPPSTTGVPGNVGNFHTLSHRHHRASPPRLPSPASHDQVRHWAVFKRLDSHFHTSTLDNVTFPLECDFLFCVDGGPESLGGVIKGACCSRLLCGWRRMFAITCILFEDIGDGRVIISYECRPG